MCRLKQLMLEHVSPRHLTLPMVAVLAACDPMGDFLGPGTTGCFFCITPSPPVAFAVSPDSANILLRDTITLSAWSCPNGGCFVGNPVVSAWTITGDAVGATNAPALAAASGVLLRASELGESMVTAVAGGDDTKRQTVRISVADSSAISSIALRTCCNGVDTVLTYGDILAWMLDQQGKRYRAQPTHWSLSDSSMITLGDSSRFGPGSRTIRVHRAGVVEIRAAFLSVESRLRIVVRP